MRLARICLTLVLLVVSLAPVVGQGVTVDQMRLAFFDYDPALPLRAELSAAPLLKGETATQRGLRKRLLLHFDSAHDQRVPAILTLPLGRAGRRPAVVLLAGSGGHKDTDYIRIASDMMATLGYVTISIDTQYHGDRARTGRTGDIHLIDQTVNRDAWVQTVVDLRRAVDYLTTRNDVDAAHIGMMGFSQGGMIGATFAGVEPRLAAVCLAVAGGGLLEWGKKTGLIRTTDLDRVAMNAAIVDPIYHIGRMAGRPLLMLSASRDELIPKEATDALFAAAQQPKEIKWYPSGHILPPMALIGETRAFFQKYLGGKAEH